VANPLSVPGRSDVFNRHVKNVTGRQSRVGKNRVRRAREGERSHQKEKGNQEGSSHRVKSAAKPVAPIFCFLDIKI
jgi:hypothetical protein